MKRMIVILSLAMLAACGGDGSSGGGGGGSAPSFVAALAPGARLKNALALKGITPLDLAHAGADHFFLLGPDASGMRLAKVDASTGMNDLSFAPAGANPPKGVLNYAGDGSMVFDPAVNPIAIAYDVARDRLYVLASVSKMTWVYGFSGDGLPDASFGPSGIALYAGSGYYSILKSIVFQFQPSALAVDPSTGAIVVAGTADETTQTTFGSSTLSGIAIVRFDLLGNLDVSFSSYWLSKGVGLYLAAQKASYFVDAVTVSPNGDLWVAGQDRSILKRAALILRVDSAGAPLPSFSTSGTQIPSSNGGDLWVYGHPLGLEAARIWVVQNQQTQFPIVRSVLESGGQLYVAMQPESASAFAAVLRIDLANGAMAAGVAHDPAWLASFGAGLALEGGHLAVAFTAIDANYATLPVVTLLDATTLDPASFGMSFGSPNEIHSGIVRSQPGRLDVVVQNLTLAEVAVEQIGLP